MVGKYLYIYIYVSKDLRENCVQKILSQTLTVHCAWYGPHTVSVTSDVSANVQFVSYVTEYAVHKKKKIYFPQTRMHL